MFGSVQSMWSGKCLDLPGGDTTNGNNLWVWDCNGHGSQMWLFFKTQLIYLGDTRKCADAGDSKLGTQLFIWDCNSHPSQKWNYDPNMKSVYLASTDSENADKCMDLNGGSVQVWGCNGHTNQQWSAQPEGGQTSVTDQLNINIKPGTSGIYTGGKGILIRNPFDGYEAKANYKVVPATFWTNDMITPTGAFPSGTGFRQGGNGNPNCPNAKWNGYYKMEACGQDTRTGDTGPWNYASTGYIISSKINYFFHQWDKVQQPKWGNGVFYPTDSNSVDQRCRWLASDNGYDCPGGWIPWGKSFVADAQGKPWVHNGAGAYNSGNPYAESGGGGGAGCHFDGYNQIDQTNAPQGGLNLVSDADCQCQYAFKDKNNWGDWVDQWIQHADNPKALDGWFAKGKSPGHGLDQVSCWLNNPRDMINLQNTIYLKRNYWSNQKAPLSQWDGSNPPTLRVYWGWNEVPINADQARDVTNRDAVMIKLPAALCPGTAGGLDTVACLSYGAQQNLEGDFDIYVGNNMMVPGSANVGNQPGSYVVFVREYIEDYSASTFQRWFYCENWISPTWKYQVRFVPKSASNPTGACFLDWGPKAYIV